MTKAPFFSIIVVCLNAADLIQMTIESILQQTCTDFEIIVKDGQSKDGTLEKVPVDSRIRVFSERDTSIYDAMNQATHYSTGRYLIYMNCGDMFASETVLEQVKACIGGEQPAMVYGDYDRDGIVHRQPTKLTPFYLYRTPLCHQTIFFDGQLLRTMAPYDTSYRVLADYDLELQIFKQLRLPTCHVNVWTCTYLGGGYSETEKGGRIKKEERMQILEKRFTMSECRKFELMRALTIPGIRSKIVGGAGPKWLKRVYQAVVNLINNKK